MFLPLLVMASGPPESLEQPPTTPSPLVQILVGSNITGLKKFSHSKLDITLTPTNCRVGETPDAVIRKDTSVV